MTLRTAAVAGIALALVVAACGGGNNGDPTVVMPCGVELDEEDWTVLAFAGAEVGQFIRPTGITLDSEGSIFVVDSLAHRVQRIDHEGYVKFFGEEGTGPGQFTNPRSESFPVSDGPWGIAVDADGFIYVADSWNHRVQKFSADFTFVDEWSEELFGPRGVATVPGGNVLVADTGNKRIIEYTSSGERVGEYGGPGEGPGEFDEPTSISVTSEGDIYIADYWNRRIQRFDDQMQYLGEFEVASWGSQGIIDRAYIAVLADGSVLATDPANAQIVVFDCDGEQIDVLPLPTEQGATPRPIGIAVDAAQQYAFITDAGRSVVLSIRLAPVAVSED